jgi:hypothetical protein
VGSDKRGTIVDPVIRKKWPWHFECHRPSSANYKPHFNSTNFTMPRSKRARVVHESKTTKKDHKEQTRRLYANIRECVEEYDHLFLFAVDNMRNTYLKDVRAEFSDSRYVSRNLVGQYCRFGFVAERRNFPVIYPNSSLQLY